MSGSQIMNGDKDIRAIEAAAARWFVRMQDHPVSKETEAQFDAWLEQAAEHRECYLRCELTLALTRGLEGDADLEADLQECSRIAAREAAIEAAEQSPSRRALAWLRPAWASAAAVALLAVGTGGYLLVNRGAHETYQTGVGEQRTIVLTDDSTVTLNTDTSLSVAMSGELRRIDLQRGEAIFSVAHDSSRPFEVWASGGRVRAVGTEFGVELDRDQVTVSVLEGIVMVIPNAGGSAMPAGVVPPIASQLEANKSVSYRLGGAVSAVQTADLRRIAAWREGKLVFDEMPLVDAIAEYNRYTTRKVVLGSEDIGRRPVSGVLKLGDAESLMFLVRESLGLQVVERGGSVLLLAPGAPNAAN
jgi:transmembrane sensor